VEREKNVTRGKKSSVGAKGRGLFKLRRHIEDVDVEIRKGSLKASERKLRDMRGR